MSGSPRPRCAAAALLARRVAARERGAIFSRDRVYRYLLWRRWAGGRGLVLFIALNPSTADSVRDDPTIRRCVAFAKRVGAGGMLVANLFAFRATQVRDLRAAVEPVGRATDRWLRAAAQLATLRVACWGMHGALRQRSAAIRGLLEPVRCFGVTRSGEPRHPLYLRREAVLVPCDGPARSVAARRRRGIPRPPPAAQLRSLRRQRARSSG